MNDSLEKTLIEWAATRNDEVVFNPRDGYYSFGIVTDAYEKGVALGKNEMLEELRKRFVSGLKIAATAMNEMVRGLGDKGFIAQKAFINHSLDETSIILSVSEDTYLNDEFIDYAFNKAADLHTSYLEKDQVNINISFIDETDNLNLHLLKSDGFDFMYSLIEGKELTL